MPQTRRVSHHPSGPVFCALTYDQLLLSRLPRVRMTLPGQLAMFTVLSHVPVW